MSVGRNTAYNLVGAIVPVVLALVTVPIYLKLVGPERYGVLAIAWLLLGYFGFFDLGLGRSTSFRIASLRDAPAQARADTFWAALAVNVGMGAAGALLLFLAGGYFFANVFKVDEALRPEILASVPLLASAVPIATLTGTLTGALQGREKFLETNMVSLISTTFFQLFPLAIAAFVGPDIVMLLAAAICARIAAILVLAYRCYVEFARGQLRRLNRAEIPFLLKYGGWVNLSSLVGQALVMIDRFMIGAVLGAASVAIYTVSLQLAQRIQILPGAVTNALFPRLSSSSPADLGNLAELSSRTLFAVMGLPVLGAIFLLEPFLVWWVGESVGGQSAPLGRIVLIGYWINSIAFVAFVRLQTSGRPDLVTKTMIAEMPVYAVALYYAMTHFGFIGCALVFAARCFVDYLILTWLGTRAIRQWKILAFSTVVLTSAAYLAGRWSIMEWGWWVSAVALGLLMLATSWLVLPSEIKARILSSPPLSRLPGRRS